MVDQVSAAPLGLGSPPNMATGSFTGSGNAASLILGFMARSIKIVDETNNITYEKLQGMVPANTLKTVAAGTRTVDATSLVTVPVDVGLNEPGSSVLLAAGVCPAGALLSFVVLG